jgi:pimeloyl-ACP methyl ester carboxylesterase
MLRVEGYMTATRVDYLEEMKACAAAIGLRPKAFLQPEDRWATINGIDFHYVDWGNDHLPPLVLLHGGSLTAHTWDMAALILRDRYHVIAPDQRGHGDSGHTPDDRLSEDNGDLMLQDTEAFIDHLGYPKVILCGMSMGGMNSIRFAARHADRLDALVIVDIAPVTMTEGLVEMEAFRRETETMRNFEDFLERAVKFNPQRKPAHLKYSLLHSLKQVEDGWTWKQDVNRYHRDETRTEEEQQAERKARSEALWGDVKAISTQTLLMRGAISKILAPESAEAMRDAMQDCELVVIPNAGHSVQGDNPQTFAHELDSYVSRRLGLK